MSLPVTLDNLSDVYKTMSNKWIINTNEWRIDSNISLEDSRVYNAIYTYGNWDLQPKAWQRLQNWLKPLVSNGILYSVNPTNDGGKLHFTFHQLSSMLKLNESKESIKPINYNRLFEFLREIRGIIIHYRGLLVTPTGIALCGFPADDLQLQKLMNLRSKLSLFLKEEGIEYNPPYINDLCHSTLFRWTSSPSEYQINYIKNQLIKWDETYFGSCTPVIWHHGLGTLLMRQPNTIDLQTITLPIFIAHRGLINGPSKMNENRKENIKELIRQGTYVEIDIWYNDGQLYVGHDEPLDTIDFEELLSPYLWIHTKNKDALEYLMAKRKEGHDLHLFWHTTDNYCITSNNSIIVYPGEPLIKNSVFMMPENSNNIKLTNDTEYICSDYFESVSSQSV